MKAPWKTVVERRPRYDSTTGERKTDDVSTWIANADGKNIAILVRDLDPSLSALLAAAPELLEALKGIVAMAEDTTGKVYRVDYAALSTLIAKAEAKEEEEVT